MASETRERERDRRLVHKGKKRKHPESTETLKDVTLEKTTFITL